MGYKMIVNIISLILMVGIAGCAAQNAEQITWDSQGQKISQTRTGFVAFLYWFGVEKYQIKNKGFSATTINAWGKSDPNSIKAFGGAAGELTGTAIKKVIE